MAKWIFLPLWLIVLGVALLLGYQWAKSNTTQDIYRERLIGLENDFNQLNTDYNVLTDQYNNLANQFNALADQYNEAIVPRPVTELFVEDGKVCLAVRLGDGRVIRKQTDFDVQANQVYVDYVVVDQRLLIRRAFEFNKTTAVPPDKVVYIDEELLDIDWDIDTIPYGKALSCSKLVDGRYIISVAGNGSLDLKKVADEAEVELEAEPIIKQYAPVSKRVEDHEPVKRATEDAQKIGVGDVWRHLFD